MVYFVSLSRGIDVTCLPATFTTTSAPLFRVSIRNAPSRSTPASSAASETNGLLTDLMLPSSTAESTSAAASEAAEESRDNALGLTKAEAAAMLADPMMVLVNHTNKMPDNYTFDTKECG